MILISGLNFTVEESVDNKLPFLNVMIEKTETTIKTKVYRKPTDVGMCLNAEGECPDRYKVSVVKGFLYRARDLCSEKLEVMNEISRSKQILINNGYSNRLVDAEIAKFLKKNYPPTEVVAPPSNDPSPSTTTTTTTDPPTAATTTTAETTTTTTAPATTELDPSVQPLTTGTTHKVFYQNFMNPQYKRDEQRLRRILKENVTVKDRRDSLQLIIYYRSTKTRDLIMKNNLTPKVRDLARANLIYDFRCSIDECAHRKRSERTYSGMTTCTKSRRLTYHLQSGAIKMHAQTTHGRKITRKEIVEMTETRCYQNDKRRLEILEALIIHFEDPEINRQDTGRKKVLKLYGSGRINKSTNGNPR